MVNFEEILKNMFCRFEVISISATKEEQLRVSLQKMKEDWTTISLSTSQYKYDIIIYKMFGEKLNNFFVFIKEIKTLTYWMG